VNLRRIVIVSLVIGLGMQPILNSSLFEIFQFSIISEGGFADDLRIGNEEVVWSMDPKVKIQLIDSMPRSSSLVTVTLLAPYGSFAEPTVVYIFNGFQTRKVIADTSVTVTIRVEKFKYLEFSVDKCVIPNLVDPNSLDARSLCLGFANLEVKKPGLRERISLILNS